MSLKKHNRVSVKDINNLTATMTMDEIRRTETFQDMPKSIYVASLDRNIPKSALRRKDLAAAYLMYGGQIVPQQRKELKHFRPSIKKSSVEKKLDKHRQSLTRDHKGSLKKLRHDTKQAVRFHGASPTFLTNLSNYANNNRSCSSDSCSSETDTMSELTDELSLSLSMQDRGHNNIDNDF